MNYSKLTLQLIKADRFRKVVRNFGKLWGVSTNEDNLILKVDESDEEHHYPLVWLRDNCTCKECFHQDSYSRIIDWNKFNPDVGVKKVVSNRLNDGVEIEWDDSHKSFFNLDWLKERGFLSGARKRSCYRPSKTLWNGSDFLQIARKYNYQDVMTSDKSLSKWITDLAVYGAVFMENASIDSKANRWFAEKVAFVRKTHYEEEFRVTSKPGTSNVAYLSSALQLHTDLPYYEYVPGVINLHCITQADGAGGESLLCDGFYVAEKLRREHKDVFDLLSTVKVNWLDIGEDEGRRFHSDFRSPMICLDENGNIEKIRHSVPQRGSHFSVDINVVKPWYQALRKFVDLLNKHTSRFKLKPGEMLAFDNTRIIHGREGYTDTESKQRFVIGLYMDWDELYSKLKVLETTM